MQQLTRQHLRTAEENRELAAELIGLEGRESTRARWAAVCGFYATVHYVNAYFWELRQVQPINHAERTSMVVMAAGLNQDASEYERLRNQAFVARYQPGYKMQLTIAQTLLDDDLEAIRAVIVPILNAQP